MNPESFRREMEAVLGDLLFWVWVGCGLFIFVGVFLLLATRWRATWLRCTAAESAFYLRLGIPRRIGEKARLFSEGHAYVIFMRCMLIVSAVLILWAAGQYVYFKRQLQARLKQLTEQSPSVSQSR